MVDGIGAAIASLAAALELGKSVVELRDIEKVRQAVSELNGQIIAAQTLSLSAQKEQATLLSQVENLMRQIAAFEGWAAEASKYRLTKIGYEGIYVYLFHPDARPHGSEPSHAICPNCYQDRRKSILQPMNMRLQGFVFNCPHCKSEFHAGSQDIPELDLKLPPREENHSLIF